MIEAKLELLEEKTEVLLPAAMVHFEPAFGESPEVLDPIDMLAPTPKGLAVVDPHVTKALEIELVVGPVAIGVDPRLRNDVLLDLSVKGLSIEPGGEDDAYGTLSFEEAEHRDFSCGAAPSDSLAVSSEVGFIHLDLALHWLGLGLALSKQDRPEPPIVAKGRLPIDAEVSSRTLGRYHQPKQPYQLLECPQREPRLSRPGCKPLSTASTFPSSISQPVGLSRLTIRTRNMNATSCHFQGAL